MRGMPQPSAIHGINRKLAETMYKPIVDGNTAKSNKLHKYILMELCGINQNVDKVTCITKVKEEIVEFGCIPWVSIGDNF